MPPPGRRKSTPAAAVVGGGGWWRRSQSPPGIRSPPPPKVFPRLAWLGLLVTLGGFCLAKPCHLPNYLPPIYTNVLLLEKQKGTLKKEQLFPHRSRFSRIGADFPPELHFSLGQPQLSLGQHLFKLIFMPSSTWETNPAQLSSSQIA